MIYTKYFTGFTKENGQANVSPDQFRRIMNIVFVEGRLQGINQIKTKEKTAFRYDIMLFNQDSTFNMNWRTINMESTTLTFPIRYSIFLKKRINCVDPRGGS